MKRIRIGNNLAITWLLYENDGEIHVLEDKDLELYMVCGGYKYVVPDYTVTENAVAWTFPAAFQKKTGYYRLVLVERDTARGIKSYDVNEAFCLEPEDALTNIKTIITGDASITVKSVLTYANITNIASVDTVETSDGKSTVVHVTLTNGKTFTLPFAVGSESFQEINVIDSLNSSSVDDALSANQGRVLKGLIDNINEVTVLDTLTSASKDAALSANMGRRLKELIDSIETGGGGGVTIINDLTTGGSTYALSAEMGKYLKSLIDSIDGGGVTPGGDTVPGEYGVQAKYSSVVEPGTPDSHPLNWHSGNESGDIWLAIRFLEGNVWGSWVIINIGDYEAVYASFKSFVFTRSDASSVSAPTGGSYSFPYPDGGTWTDGIPAGTGKIWMTSRRFTSDDNAHGDSAWATPRVIADSGEMDYEFSSAENPGTPSKTSPTATQTNPLWSDTADETTIWMAMRRIKNDAYSGNWMIVKIKGENGQDGTALAIKGTVSDVADLPSSDNTEGDAYILSTNGHLYVWDGDSWVDVGVVRGEDGADGATPFIHIKYSNDGGNTFTSNSGETPGDWIGIYWDYNSVDSSDVSSYTWHEWKGEDGFGYEYIFKLTTDETAPNLPSTSSNVDDYVPTGWTDDPGGVSAEYPFCWVAWRKKEDGVWSAWHGTTNGKARLHSHYGKDGEDGTVGVDGKDALPIRIRNWADIAGVTLIGNNRVFSGFEDNAPFRDVIVVTGEDYPSGISYPFSTGGMDVPVLLLVNYSSTYSDGYSGTNLSLPTSSSYTNTTPANKADSSTLYGQGKVYSVFQNLGAVYASILVATQAYIGGLTVDHLTTNAGNNSYITIDDGFITFYDSNGRLRLKMGQDTGDTSPVLKFYGTSGNELYNLGPDGIALLGSAVYPEMWVPSKFWMFSSLPSEGQTYTQANGVETWLNQYTCARRTVNNVVEYFVNGSWQSTASPYDGKYYQGQFTLPSDGYYVIDNLGWANQSSGKRAIILHVVTSGGTRQCITGHMDLSSIDQQSGTSGTIDDIKWDN